MKALNIIFSILAFIGIYVAVCLQDGSQHEAIIRLAGTMAFGLFGLLAKAAARKAEQ